MTIKNATAKAKRGWSIYWNNCNFNLFGKVVLLPIFALMIVIEFIMNLLFVKNNDDSW